jgi:transglutaminase-like putative cysteine protease
VTATINVTLDLDIESAGDLALCIAATAPGLQESLAAEHAGGDDVPIREVRTALARTHVLSVPRGQTRVTYHASAGGHVGEGGAGHDGAAQAVDEAQALLFTRPSRYCPSDRLAGLAAAEFGHLDRRAAVFAVEQWIHDTVSYVPGATDAVDDALHPLLARTGVCRDFAHMGVAMCRALGIPARYTAAYAPGLDPMDFHAVVEAAVDGSWYVFDATRLAPRASLVRIGSGRDAADVALLTPVTAVLGSMSQELIVTTAPPLPVDDRTSLVALALGQAPRSLRSEG